MLDLRSVEPRKILPWSSALLQSAGASCPPGPALPRFPTAFAGRSRSTARVYLSWGSFPLRTPLRRVPLLATRLSPRGGRGSPDPRRCRPQGSCPSRRFWLRSRRARTLARSAALRDAPTLRGLVPCRSRPWETPSRAFPSRGAVPALASLVLPCGFMVDRRRCDALGRFTTAFPTAPSPLPTCQTWGLTSDCGAVTEVSCGS